MTLHETIVADQVKTDNTRRMLHKWGQVVAEGDCGVQWWACDGVLWCDRSHTQLTLSGRYPEDIPADATRV